MNMFHSAIASLGFCLIGFWTAPGMAGDTEPAHIDGAALYAEQCAPCHGDDAKGGNAPDITGVSAQDINYVISGFEEMPEIDVSEAGIEALARFLQDPEAVKQ